MNEREIISFLFVLTSLILLSSCVNYENNMNNSKDSNSNDIFLKCLDGTIYSECSQNKPLYCDDGTLINASSECGCPEEYEEEGQNCKRIVKCSDNTLAGECSKNKPYYCRNGGLISEPDICGCPEDEILKEHLCISKYFHGAKEITLFYVLRDVKGQFNFTVYEGFNEYFSELPRKDDYRIQEEEYITNKEQKELLTPLVEAIKSMTSNKDDQARIVISFVQHIPYDIITYLHNYSGRKYPYEVLYTGKGVCGEKSKLAAFLLKELRFGVALLDFEDIQHQTLGIKCDPPYSLYNTSYCFVEMNSRSIITDSEIVYDNEKTINDSKMEIVYSSEGNKLESVAEEYNDTQELHHLLKHAVGNELYPEEWREYKRICFYYGLREDWE